MEEVFPLFTPEGEKKWAPGWDYTSIFPMDGTLEENMLFTTASQDHKQTDAIGMVIKYDPDQFQVTYLRVEPDVKVGIIEVVCRSLGEKKTAATITYTYTALSETGNEFIAAFTEDHYRLFISDWQTALNHYLKTGRMLTQSARPPH